MTGRGAFGERKGSHVETRLLVAPVKPHGPTIMFQLCLSLLYSATIFQYVSIYVSASNRVGAENKIRERVVGDNKLQIINCKKSPLPCRPRVSA